MPETLTPKQALKRELKARKEAFRRTVADYILVSPTETHVEIAAKFGIPRQAVDAIAAEFSIRRKRGAGSPAWKKR